MDHDILSFVLPITRLCPGRLNYLLKATEPAAKAQLELQSSGSLLFPLIIMPYCFCLTLNYPPRTGTGSCKCSFWSSRFPSPVLPWNKPKNQAKKPSLCQLPQQGTAENDLATHTHLGPITLLMRKSEKAD